MNWCSQVKRLAIYLRDGLACVYCNGSISDGVKLTLDHLKPYIKGGNNDASNLVTCCHRCNSSRGKRSYVKFAELTAQYLNHGITGIEIVKHMRRCVKRKLDTAAARELIEKRGSCFNVLKNL